MNYKKIYDAIIKKSKLSPREKGTEYFERHHITPRCLGGSDDTTNLALLTAKEHFICHHLLTKIHPTSSKLHNAFWMMLICASPNQHRHKTTGKAYQVAKQIQAQIRSELWKTNNPNTNRSNAGVNNPMYGSCRTGKDNPFFGKKHSDETKAKIGEKNSTKIWSTEEKEKLSDSWKNRPIIICPHCGKESIHAANMRRYHFDKCKLKTQE